MNSDIKPLFKNFQNEPFFEEKCFLHFRFRSESSYQNKRKTKNSLKKFFFQVSMSFNILSISHRPAKISTFEILF